MNEQGEESDERGDGERDLGRALAAACPGWATGTIVVRDRAGAIVGTGTFRRAGAAGVEVTIGASSVVRLPAASPPEGGG